mgnify:FL=1
MFTKNKEKKSRRISAAVAEAIMSGDNWLEATQILQALRPVEDLLRSQIEGLQAIVDEFRNSGGTMEVRDRTDGYDVVAKSGYVMWKFVFNTDGRRTNLVIEDSTPDKADPDTIRKVKEALEAAYEIPRREFALTELERIVAYVENDNALAGLDRIRELLSDNENIVYQTASSASLNDVDISSIMEVRK